MQPRQVIKTSFFLRAILLLFGLGILIFLFTEAMVRGIGKDEHQFITSGWLLAQEGQIPYIDYPYFHMPYLVFIYAFLFRFIHFYLLGARLFSLLSAVATLGSIFYLTQMFFRDHPPIWRFGVPAGVVLLLAANPVFAYTSGQAWNHDFTVLLSIWAFAIHYFALLQGKPPNRMALSGALIGLATGVRLVFLVAAVPFIIAIFIIPKTAINKTRMISTAWFGLGFGLALLPAVILFAMAPAQFLFGNLSYPRLNTVFRQSTGYTRAMTLNSKFVYLFDVIAQEPGLWILLASLTLSGLYIFLRKDHYRKTLRREVSFFFLTILCLFLGGLAPTPSFLQYFYAPIPFAIFGVAFVLSTFQNRPNIQFWLGPIFTLATIVTVITGLSNYPPPTKLPNLDSWATNQIHEIGEEINSLAAPGKVLTLSPIYALEGGRSIYGPLALGPFAWRTAPYISAELRREYGVVSEREFESLLIDNPPGGILVGNEGDLEQPLVDYAIRSGYRSFNLSNGLVLWIPNK